MRSSPSPPTQRAQPTTETVPWLSCSGGLVHLALRVQPRSSRNAVKGTHGAELKVLVTAPPVDAAANQALIHLLAEMLGCPRRDLWIVHGHTSRQKIVAVQGLSPETIRKHLAPTAKSRP